MNIYFVHHPSVEPFYGANLSIGKRVQIPWTIEIKNCSGHKRKFICRDGQFITTSQQQIQNGWLSFWGEYEVGSEAEIVSLHKAPKGIHDVLPQAANTTMPQDAMNTDPYVFGDNFRYICCQMSEDLDLGDVVLFGNLHQGNFYFDTVFVCEGFSETKNQKTIDPEYYYAAILPMKKQPQQFAIGRMYQQGQDIQTPFSFVPCLDSQSPKEHKVFSFAQRPFVTAQQMEFNPDAHQRTKPVPFTQQKWQHILDAVKNFSLGIAIRAI